MALPADQIGRVLGGRYRVIAAVGSGASAQVYLADDVALRRRVAVKVLHPALADDPVFLKRFRAEAQAAANLSHPHIMAVFDWGDASTSNENQPYIVAEYLGGGSLRTMLDAGHRLSLSQALLVGYQAAQALDYAHRRGLVHRDIKPANLLFDDEARLRVADFGLARALAESTWTEPEGVVLGTARYMSPEQAAGQPVDAKTDVYSLALVMVEAVTGDVPFSADNLVSMRMARIDQSLPVPEDMGALASAVEAAGRADPAERSDAAQFAKGLVAAATELARPAPLVLVRPVALREEEQPGVPAPVFADDLNDDSVPGRVSVFLPTARAGAGAAERVDGPAGMGTTQDTQPVTHAPTLHVGQAPPGAAVTREQAQVRNDVTAIAPPAMFTGAPPIDPEALRPERPRRSWGRRIWRAVSLIVSILAVGAVAAIATIAVRDRNAASSLAVPNMVGKTQDVASSFLSASFHVETKVQRKDGVDKGVVLAQDPSSGKLNKGDIVVLTVADGPEQGAVPDLTGQTEAAAASLLQANGFKEAANPQAQFDENVPPGQVISWSPTGANVDHGTQVKLVISNGPAPRPIPDLSKLTYDDAAAKITALGLQPVRSDIYSDTIDADKVIDTQPAAGQQAARGAQVTIEMSKGPQPVPVPSLIGQSLDQAISRLQSVGLQAGNVYGHARKDARVVATDPRQGTPVPKGTNVDITIG